MLAVNARSIVAPLVVSAALALLALERLPFLDQPLLGEEGLFAYMISAASPPLEPCTKVLLIGRFHGTDVRGCAEHPVPPYLLLTWIWRPLFGERIGAAASIAAKSGRARLPFVLCFALALSALAYQGSWLFRGGRWRERMLALSLLAFVLSSPLMVGGSLQAQIDGSIGVLLVAAAAAFLHVASGARSAAVRFIAPACAGLLGALGKNEWALSLLAAGLVAAILAAGSTSRRDSREALLQCAALIGGLLLGTLISCSLDAESYLGGINVMGRIHSAGRGRWLDTFWRRLPWIWPLFPLAAFSAALFIADRRKSGEPAFPEAALLFWGLALSAGYLLSSWNSDGFPRYFCTSLIALLCFTISALSRARFGWLGAAVLSVCCLAGTAFHARTVHGIATRGQSATSNPGTSLSAAVSRWRELYEKFQRTREAVVADGAFAFYYPDADFVLDSLGVAGIESVLAKHGKPAR
jgi:hypothetical protein